MPIELLAQRSGWSFLVVTQPRTVYIFYPVSDSRCRVPITECRHIKIARIQIRVLLRRIVQLEDLKFIVGPDTLLPPINRRQRRAN